AVCFCVMVETGKEPSRWNAYPVHTTERGFVTQVRSRKKEQDRSPLFGLPVDGYVWAFIEETQPYKRPHPDEDVLTILTYFSNRDKHRALSVHKVFSDLTSIEWITDSGLLEMVPLLGPLSFKDSTQVARLRFADPDAEVSMDGYLGLHPSFGDDPSDGGKGMQTTLGAIGVCLDTVDVILDELGM
ncbi:MAG: hypothetical protein LC799_32755, partial [Actinobacteria bacterium]|nr:hypothetical protein [Actinomycetota bacterium]